VVLKLAAKLPLRTKLGSVVRSRVPLYACQGSVPSSKPPFNSNSSGLAVAMVLTASDIRTVSEIRMINRETFEPETALYRNTDKSNRSHHVKSSSIHNEAAEKEM
jgi:hypothetical protein